MLKTSESRTEVAVRRSDVVDGRTGPGSVYRLVRPTNWNGILLLYAHGYISKDEPVGITPDSIERSYTPTGDLRIPALTLSTFRDPVVPGFHRTIYGQEVAANGDADSLVQRSVPGYAGGYGHCTFTPQELTQAFLDLVIWGEYGIKPTP